MALNFRTLKGSAFNHVEVDNNFNALVNSSSIHEGGKQIKLYTGMTSGSFTGTTASYNLNANTASYALFAVSASHEITTETFSSTATSASHAVRADIAESALSATTATSASFATFANASTNATMAVVSTSSSFATFANASTTAETATTATTANTASFISDTFISASAVRSGFGSGGSSVSASFATFANNTTTAETATTANTASFVSDTFISASAVRSGFGSSTGTGNGFPYTGSAQISGSLTLTGSNSFVKIGNTVYNSNRDLSVSGRVAIVSNNNANANLLFGDTDDDGKGSIRYDNTTDSFEFRVNGNKYLGVDSSQSASYIGHVSASHFKGDGSQLTNITTNTALTASYFGEGLVTASAAASTITFTKDNGTTFDVTVAQSGSVESASYATFANNTTTAETSTSSSFATFANASTTAGSATTAISASFATFANSSTTAGTATTATTATSSSFATFANSSTSAGTATTATTANTASYISDTFISASAVRSGFGGGSSVSSSFATFANASTTSETTTTASFATFANSSTTAGTATSANTASYISDTFISASAVRSGFGGGSSVSASFATFANSSTTAESANSATTATSATSASFATFANSSTTAGSATTATTATSASFATFANSSTTATTATTATSASFATFANSSTTAGTATTATSASVAELGNYTAQWGLGANGSNHYTFNGPGLSGAENDPTIYLTRGQKYKFINNMDAHPFRIQSTPNGSAGTAYNDGVTNNNVQNGTLTWNVQFDSPTTLYYQCTAHPNMGGIIKIDNASTGSGGGSTDISALNTFTGSAQTSINNLTNATSSYALASTVFTAGAGLAGSGNLGDNRTFDVGSGDGITVNTNDIQVDATVLRTHNGYVLSGSSPTFAALTVTGDITANKITTNITSASVAFTTGSNKFGDEQSDKHMFTGSVAISGSIAASNLSGTNTGNETKTSINALDITEVGTITSGVWNGSAISTTYLSNTSGTNTGDESDASATTKGIVELATTAETSTGTDTTRAVTPKGLADQNYTTNTGTVTSIAVTTATGLDGATTITGSGTIALSLDLSELTDMTAAVNGSQDELILLDNGAERRKQISEVTLSDFNNDSGWTSNAGTVTSVSAGSGLYASSSSPTPVIGVEYNNTANNIILRAADGTSNGHKIDSSDYILVNSGANSYRTVYKKNVSDLPFTTNTGTVDTSGTPVDNDYAKFTDANTIEGRSISEVRSDLSISNVQNIDIRTFTGSTNIVTVGGGALTANVDSIAGLGLRAHGGKLQVSSSDTITVGNSVSINLAGLPDMTQAVTQLEDELIILDNSTQKRKLISEIPVSAFNNDANYGIGTGDITAVNAGSGLDGGASSGAATLAIEYANTTNNIIMQAVDDLTYTVDADDYILVNKNANSYRDVAKVKVSGLPYNNYTHPNHSGDVTSTADGATTIGSDKVTYAKMQNIPTANILGRVTTGTGNVEDLTATQVRTLLNVADGATANSGDITSVAAGSGMTGGGTSGATTITLGDPSTLTAASTNGTTATSHTHAITVTTAGAASTIVSTDANQQITADNFISTSDKRLKSKIKPIQEGLETIKKFVSYEYELNGKPDAGFIAQEVQEHIPYAVSEKDNGYLAMNTKPILAHLHKAILELDKRLTDIENKL